MTNSLPLIFDPASHSSFSDSSDTVSDISLPDVTKLKPYDFEPEASSSEDDNIDISNEEKSRIGNVDWCVCGKCRPMQTFTESLCCRDTNEVPDDLFEGL